MLYYLLYEKLVDSVSFFNVFRYLTFRTAYAGLTALLVSLILGPWMVRKLREFQIGQVIRGDGPGSHQGKAGTPTMGGLLILASILIPTLLWADLANRFVWLAMGATVSFGIIGFWDDYQKVIKRQSEGLTARNKLRLQIVVALGVGFVLLVLSARGVFTTRMIFPFFKRLQPDLLIHSFLDSVWSAPLAFFPFPAAGHPGTCGIVECRKPHRWVGRIGHRLCGDCQLGADGSLLRGGSCSLG